MLTEMLTAVRNKSDIYVLNDYPLFLLTGKSTENRYLIHQFNRSNDKLYLSTILQYDLFSKYLK